MQTDFSKIARDFIEKVRDRQQERNRRASGESARSLRFVAIPEKGFTVFGAGYFEQQEYGRGPTKAGGKGELKQKIYEWMKYKGIAQGETEAKKRGIAFVIARKIHQQGIKVPRSGQYPLQKVGLEETITEFIPIIQKSVIQGYRPIITAPILRGWQQV